jgi:thymidylate synthase (FAD)
MPEACGSVVVTAKNHRSPSLAFEYSKIGLSGQNKPFLTPACFMFSDRFFAAGMVLCGEKEMRMRRDAMIIIDQSHDIISLPDNLLQVIEAAGRTCYKSEEKITPDSAAGFVARMRDRGHHAMIEFGDIIVRFVTNRGVTHELVRHRLCSFAQESTRYVRYDGKMEFIRPCWWDDSTPAQQTLWQTAMADAETRYLALLESGWRPEQAREVLPNSLKTEIVVKGNIREWRHIFALRCTKKAHPQIRTLMIPLLSELKEHLPVVFDDLTF